MTKITLNYKVEETSESELITLAEKEGVELTDEFRLSHKFAYYSVDMAPGEYGRNAEISSIICDQYPTDKMQAVQNNYFLDPTDGDNIAEMNKMQEWRKYAKHFADSLE